VRNRSLDLLGAATLAVAAVGLVSVGAPVAVCSMLGIPLVLLAPGYVWTDVLFGAGMRAELRAVMSVALSLTVTALGGILMAVGGVRLDRSSWLLLLAGTTFAGAAVAATLRARVSNVPPAGSRQRHASPRMSVPQAARLAMAGLLGAAALGIAVHSANAQVQPTYTQLSLDRHGAAPQTAQIVLGNHEQGVQHYRLVVSTDDIVSKVWTVTVADGANWERSVPALPGHRLAVDVYRTASAGPPYRHVAISVPLKVAK
jgi:Protein of unknown function (DUF1616)